MLDLDAMFHVDCWGILQTLLQYSKNLEIVQKINDKRNLFSLIFRRIKNYEDYSLITFLIEFFSLFSGHLRI